MTPGSAVFGIILSLSSFLALVLILLGCCYCLATSPKAAAIATSLRRAGSGGDKGGSSSKDGAASVKEYGLSQIRKASKNFTTVYGTGSFGTVYFLEDFMPTALMPHAIAKRASEPERECLPSHLIPFPATPRNSAFKMHKGCYESLAPTALMLHAIVERAS